MKKLRLKKWVKYLILTIFDTIVILNLPSILKDPNILNNYRFNILIIGTFLLINLIGILKIEGGK